MSDYHDRNPAGVPCNGMRMNSGPGIAKVRGLATAERMGTITAIEGHHYRNAPYGGWICQQPICPFEMGFRTAITCQMAIASYRQQRTVRRDPAVEDIV
jgi:hypothetical protein